MKSILILILLLMISSFSPAQSIKVNINRTETDDGTKSTVLVYFVDTKSKIVYDSLDLYNLNPYNHLPYESGSTNWAKNKIYKITSFNEYDKLFPSDYRKKYFVDYYVEPERYNGLLSSTIALSSYEKHANFIAVAYNLLAQPNYSDQIDGAISTIFVFDNKKNLVYKKENVLCVDNEIAISDDGNFVAFRYGASWSDGILISGGIQIIDTRKDEVVFQDRGFVEGPSSGYYRNLIRFSCHYGNGYQRDYYFNTNTYKLFSLYYCKTSNQDILMDVKPNGLLYRDTNSKEYFLFFENDFDVSDIR